MFCERSLESPPCIDCSKSSIIQICDHFDLAPETIPSLVRLLGAFGKHASSGQPQCIQIILKAFQKGELGNWTLSLNHNFETSWTNALCIWTGWTSREHKHLDSVWTTRFEHISAQLQAVPSLWAHPTCLPLIFLQNYVGRTMNNCNRLNQDLVKLDVELGVNQSGRLIRSTGLDTDWPANLDFKLLTTGLHSANNQLVFVQQAAKWSRRALQFIRNLELGCITGCELRSVISECIDYELSMLQGVEDSFDALKARAQGATSVLFQAQNQNDMLMNTRIAASTKEDSISKKTSTFLTALFLPGTFIAALISVTMIDWLPDSQEGTSGDSASSRGGIVTSKYYWIYWVLTVPVTALVMTGWYFWYRHANRKWLRAAGLPHRAHYAKGGER